MLNLIVGPDPIEVRFEDMLLEGMTSLFNISNHPYLGSTVELHYTYSMREKSAGDSQGIQTLYLFILNFTKVAYV